MRIIISTLLLALFSHEAPAQAQDESTSQLDQKITIGEKFSMRSEILDEDRAYWVYLPVTYGSSDSQNYPVMYILDGGAHFQSATGVVQFMSSGINGNRQIPEMIVVAIPNTARLRDLTPTRAEVGYDGEPSEFLEAGGGDEFLRFINDELFPNIDSMYRTMPHRTLVGHSLGGLLALHALLDVPEMFQAYISIDPSMWWDNQILTPRAKEIFAEPRARRGSVYISQAHPVDIGGGDPNLMRNASSAFAEILLTAQSPGFRTKVEYFRNEDHGSVPLVSLYNGLLHVFDGYKISIEAVASDPSTVAEHFARFSDRLGITMIPPESLVNSMGYFLLRRMEDTEGAITVFELNVANFPQSANVYDSLGQALMANGDTDRAIENYKRSLTLDPDSDNAKDQLEKLGIPTQSE